MKSVVDGPREVQGEETNSIGIVGARWLKNYAAEKRISSIEQFARVGLDKKKPIKSEPLSPASGVGSASDEF